jgi:hypothetical protein
MTINVPLSLLQCGTAYTRHTTRPLNGIWSRATDRQDRVQGLEGRNRIPAVTVEVV